MQSKKRLSIYFFYDEDGQVDDYIPFFLKHYRPHNEKILCVVNGHITDEGRAKIEPWVDDIFLRDNYGFDAFAYKHVFDLIGYDALAAYDEVILTNFTCFGPMYDLQDMFTVMDNTPCDFWSILKNHAPNIEGVLSVHVQSFFTVYRQSLLSDPAFKAYWDGMPGIETYADACYNHEYRQTPFFESRGFTSASYVDVAPYMANTRWNCAVWNARELLVTWKSPLLKRKALMMSYGRPYIMHNPQADITEYAKLVEAVMTHTNYDVDLIFNNLSRTNDVAQLPRITRPKLKISKRILFFFFANKRRRYEEKWQAYLRTQPYFYEDFLTAFQRQA